MKCMILYYITLLTNNYFKFYTQIGETIADKVSGKPLPSIKVEEPTVKMSFSINTSPFVGREVCLYIDILWQLMKDLNLYLFLCECPNAVC